SAPPEQPGEPGDPAADHEAGDRRADQHLALVTLELPAPVERLGQLAAQRAQRALELEPVGLDRRADLLRGTLRHRYAFCTVSRMRWASSIAMSGFGGVAERKKRAATKPAMAPRISRTTATKKKPQKNWNC